MPFTTVLTGTAQVDDSIVQSYASGVIIANGEEQKLEQFVDLKEDIGSKSVQFTKYARLGLATTPLVETEDVVSTVLADTSFTVTPVEYGAAVTTTTYASLQTGGKVDLAKAKLIGIQMGQTQDQLIINTLAASANSTSVAITGTALDGAYSRLVTKSVPTISDGLYAAVMAESEIAKIRNETGFQSIMQYANPQSVLRNEVGMYKGFRIFRHQGVAAKRVLAFGYNALGKGVSKAPGFVLTPPTDKLGRFWNMGWYGVFTYTLVDTDAVENLLAP